MTVAPSVLKLEAGVWTEATNADATSITCIPMSAGRLFVRPMPSAVPPDANAAGLPIESGKDGHPTGFLKRALVDLTHVAAPVRVFLKPDTGDMMVFVETD